ncbi:MAG: TRAP transporter substrate-binding protein DctP [Pseudomonadota bacterium]
MLALGFTALAFTTTNSFALSWDVSLWGKRRAFTEHVEKLAELVDKKTDGKFKLKISYGGLSKNKANLDGISKGNFEMAQFCAGYHRDKNPTITVLELPFLGVDTLDKELAVSKAVYAHPATQKDLARWNATLLMPTPLPQYNIAGVGDAPAKLADFKGMSLRATGGIGKAFKTIGAKPVSITATEVFTSLERGLISGVAFAQHAHMAFKTVEKAKWWTTNLNPGSVNCPVVVNTKALEGLKKEYKEALLSSVDEALTHYLENYKTKTIAKFEDVLKKNEIKKVAFADAEIEAFKKAAAEPAKAAWIKDMTAKGLPAQELYDLVITTLKK